MEKKIFQSGGPIIDEDELFEDGSVAQGQEPVSGGALDGELEKQIICARSSRNY
jgi:hypothetical protein